MPNGAGALASGAASRAIGAGIASPIHRPKGYRIRSAESKARKGMKNLSGPIVAYGSRTKTGKRKKEEAEKAMKKRARAKKRKEKRSMTKAG